MLKLILPIGLLSMLLISTGCSNKNIDPETAACDRVKRDIIIVKSSNVQNKDLQLKALNEKSNNLGC